eukprot:gene9888-13301_t
MVIDPNFTHDSIYGSKGDDNDETTYSYIEDHMRMNSPQHKNKQYNNNNNRINLSMSMSVDDMNIYGNHNGTATESRATLRRNRQNSNDYDTGSNSSQSPKFTRRSMDDASLFDARQNRIAHAEAAIREEMFKHCTFRPTIKALPITYGTMKDTNAPFLVRVNKWKEKKDLELKKKSQAVQKSEIADCTFKPTISKNSERAIREMRGDRDYELPANERLYKTSALTTEQRIRMIEEERFKEEQQELEECTFQPQLVTSKNLYNDVNPKYGMPTTPKPEGLVRDWQTKDCTFTPKINKIKSNMSSAKLYTSANVVERLTRPIAVPNNHGDDESRFEDKTIMDVSTFMNSSMIISKQNNQPSYETKENMLSEDELREKKKKLEQFLGRQQQFVKRKDTNLKQIEHAMTPKFAPKLITNKNNDNNMVRTTGTKSFLDRVERQVQKKQEAEQLNETLAFTSPDCTFQPKINKKSENLRSRSVFELSRGDSLRIETNRRMLKLQNDQEELSKVTLQPSISNYAKSTNVKSKLQISQDPSLYLEKHKENLIEKENYRLLKIEEQKQKELEGCTFKPQVIECPAYVTRIAKTRQLVGGSIRDKKAALERNRKVDWK